MSVSHRVDHPEHGPDRRRTMARWSIALASALLLASGCGDGADESGVPPDGDGIASYSVTGTVLDFATGTPVDGSATVSTDGLVPAPTVSVTGADFAIDDIPPFSVFQILAGAPPTHRSTYNTATQVDEANVTSEDVYVISEQFLGELATTFGVSPAFGTSIIIGRLVDASGSPVADVPGTAFALDPGIAGPFFLDANRAPDAALSSSSSSGYFVLFDVQPGLVALTAEDGSNYTMTMPASPVAATAATLADVVVAEGEAPALPQNVSFQRDIVPIFRNRGCENCHDGGGIGKDLGNLHLNGEEQKMYKEVVQEVSPLHNVTRVNVQAPELSLLLTMPSREDPADAHPNVTFASPDDPDYQLIYAWISEGAQHN